MSHETDTLMDRRRLCKGLESCIRPGLMLIIYSAVPRAIVCLARNLISDTSLCLVDCLGLQLCSAIADTDTDSTYHNAFLRQTDSNPKSETCVRTVAYVG